MPNKKRVESNQVTGIKDFGKIILRILAILEALGIAAQKIRSEFDSGSITDIEVQEVKPESGA